MFGLNDNDDKGKEENEETEVVNPLLSGDSSSTDLSAVAGGGGPILPTTPVVSPTEPDDQTALPGPAVAPQASFEAIPGPIVPQAPSSLPMADDTMPEDTGL